MTKAYTPVFPPNGVKLSLGKHIFIPQGNLHHINN